MSLATMGTVLSLILIVLTSAGTISADDPWPTPPPGPEAPIPRAETDIKPAPVPAVPGASSWVFPLLGMQVPRFPPVPSSSFQSPDGVTVISDAGSILSTVQLVYEPISIEDAQSPISGQELRKVFDLRTFDHRANKLDLDLKRPWLLEVPARGLTEAFEDPARLLLVRHDARDGWVPLVTAYHRNQEILQALILEVGRFGVIAETGVSPEGG